MELQGKNKMADMPIKSLLLNMGGPIMISMLGQALYNVLILILFLIFQIRRRLQIWVIKR